MNKINQWLLPEGIEEVLPPEAMQLERARRELLDLFSCWGYDLVMPPLVEYLESLLTGAGNDLDLQTFKLTDQLSGRQMGVRADMTPQAARIDAHSLNKSTPTRLCYMGTVLHTRMKGLDSSRCPLQVGAELFGHDGCDSDVEILSLVIAALEYMQITNVHMDLGHVGIFRALAQEAGLSQETEAALFDALQRKAVTEINDILATSGASEEACQRLATLATLNGGADVLDNAREQLSGGGADVMAALDELRMIAAALKQHAGDVALNFDLAELRGYRYQTGMVFAVFVPGLGQEIARGGRYNDIGKVFGRARPATGFSTDLRTLVSLSQRNFSDESPAIFAPPGNDAGLREAIAALRGKGERVVCCLEGQSGQAADMGCERELREEGGGWVVKSV